MYKPIICFIAAAILAGCASTNIRQVSGVRSVTLDPQGGVYVAIPNTPSSGDYRNSGQYVSSELASKLSEHGIGVSMAYNPGNIRTNLVAARDAGDMYLFVPVLTNWEHNSTQWTFNPSTMGVRVEIFDVSTGREIRADNLTSESSHLSFFGTDPKELLDDTLDDYFDSIYPGFDDD